MCLNITAKMRKMKDIANIRVNIESSLKLSTIEFITLDVICLLDKLILLSICMVWLGLVWFGCSIF